ncbi:hypothetical protein EDC04DRAFT_3022518 [Pisolithus marmoratus]|nr:hypothetical protein EDC04DRAFT_3022518 [Pisolithus marmoratus]
MAAQPNVPYQAYRSKRHSRTVSSVPLVPNTTPPSLSRPSSIVSNGSVGIPPAFTQPVEDFETEKVSTEYSAVVPVVTNKTAVIHIKPQQDFSSTRSHSPIVESSPIDNLDQQTTSTIMDNESRLTSPVASPSQTLPSLPATQPSPANSEEDLNLPSRNSSLSRNTGRLCAHQLLGPSRISSMQSSTSDQPNIPQSPPLHSRVASIGSVKSEPSTDASESCICIKSTSVTGGLTADRSIHIQPNSVSSYVTISVAATATIAKGCKTSNSPLPKATSRPLAPYRPGFQPRGVYRPRTDEFFLARKTKADAGRIERTKLERRLEKLIHLHFPISEAESAAPKRITEHRRASSFFDLDISSIKNMDAGRNLERCIKVAGISGCKSGLNRESLRGWKILLFRNIRESRQIEEVGEGVDYGVRKRRNADPHRKGKQEDTLSEDEKFLKGVRICRNCKPILGRERYRQDVMRVPIFVRLYEAFVSLEKEIDEWLPQFQELLSTLSNDNQPTKEASTARKRLLNAFAEYDALSKRIRNLPCPPGSSQDRVQLAILTRANIFLQKNMFPLQFIPKPKKDGTSNPQPSEGPPIVDPDSELAYALQPLLEQEALLESFVGEAMAHRKFEDAKTLKANLAEIRLEIDRMLSSGTA